jgi:hypothetical protein
MNNYDSIKHELDTKLIQASNLASNGQQLDFVNATFKWCYQHYEDKHINHEQYVKLINSLARYKQGSFNDYLDMLAGAALVGCLDLAIQGSKQDGSIFTPERARQQQEQVNRITGMKPITPEQEEK